MNEEIINKIKELYDNIMYFPNKVLSIFNDFFGEERVDMQGFLDFNHFLTLISESTLNTFFPNKSAVFTNSEFINSSKENKAIIEELINNGALDSKIVDNEILAVYFLPIIATEVSYNLDNGSILVHFPHVRVTNEFDKYVDINNLWVRVYIKTNGSSAGYFGMNRSEYELSHLISGYLHSHVSHIPFDDFTRFTSPCLGNGPIKNTLATLAIGYDEAMWKLFCLELDRYVRIESVSGGPYHSLERISNDSIVFSDTDFSMKRVKFYGYYTDLFSKDFMKEFIRHLIEGKKLKFNFINGSYGLAMSYLEYIILVSNEFIKWYNIQFNNGIISTGYTTLIRKGVLRECIIENNEIHCLKPKRTTGRDYYEYEGSIICVFKGEPITLHIVDNADTTENKTVLISKYIAENIAEAVLTIVNYKYGREEKRDEAGISTPAIYL